MSAETEYRALLLAHVQTSALVGGRIAHNAMGQGKPPPYVVFTAAHDYTRNLEGAVVDDRVTFTTQCWANNAAQAEAVADAVAACLEAAPSALGIAVLARESGYDPELGLDAVVMTVEWWP